jgi:hypothetical protein
MRTTILLLVLTGGPVIVSCGNPQAATIESSDARTPSASNRYLPLSVGARWSYHASDPLSGTTGETESIVEALDDVGGGKAGIVAFRVRSTTLTGSTVNWQQDLGSSVVRQREQFFDLSGLMLSDYLFSPSRLRLDESPAHEVKGATWTENHTATIDNLTAGAMQTGSFTVRWTVEAVDEMVTVPAGTFSCLRVHRLQTGFASSDETHWFARTVGKVKETGPEPKDLTGYSIP